MMKWQILDNVDEINEDISIHLTDNDNFQVINHRNCMVKSISLTELVENGFKYPSEFLSYLIAQVNGAKHTIYVTKNSFEMIEKLAITNQILY